MIKMPISNEEWDSGRTRDTLEAQVLTFLKQNKIPFSLVGIMSGLGYDTNIKDLETLFFGFVNILGVQNALEKLIKEGTVTAKIIKQPIGQETYYKAVELPPPAWAFGT